MRSVPPDQLRVVLHSDDAELRAAVARALAPERIRLRQPEEQSGSGTPLARPDALILDARADVPGILEIGRGAGWLGRRTPVFVLHETPLPRDRQMEWLRAGVWELMRLPVDGDLLSLKIRNLLNAQGPGSEAAADEPYGWKALFRVAEESVALARRFGRPLTVIGLRLDWEDIRTESARATVLRLAVAAGDRIRRSDLLGVSRDGSLLVLLPDSGQSHGEVFVDRLEGHLTDLLKEWGVAARLRTGTVGMAPEEECSAAELLRRAEEALA